MSDTGNPKTLAADAEVVRAAWERLKRGGTYTPGTHDLYLADLALVQAAAVAGGGERIALETRLREIQRKDRWCICPFSVEHYPHLISCPLGIATELLDLLATPLAPDAATPCATPERGGGD